MTATDSSDKGAQQPDPGPADRLAAYGAGLKQIQEWTSAATSLALLEGALAAGVLEAANEPRTPAAIAASLGTEESRMEDLCQALYARGVFDAADGQYRLSPAFAMLLDADAPQPLGVLLKRHRVTERLLIDSPIDVSAYGGLSPDDLRAMARGAAATLGSSMVRAMAEQTEATLPEDVRAALRSRRRHLELGCGIGGGLINTLLRNPTLSAVGVEREEVLLADARREAERLGVANRVEWRAMDARDVRDEAIFDSATWSQFFFPASTRAATLAAARRALRPGGYLTMPVLPDPPSTLEGWREPGGLFYTTARVIYGGWGVPIRSADELREEVAAAGFDIVGIFEAAAARMLIARRPLE